MTKTIVLGEQPDSSYKKPIEFFSTLDVSDSLDVDANIVTSKPHQWNYIELICKNYSPNLDLLFAYNDADDRGEGILVIGRWNDGVVENTLEEKTHKTLCESCLHNNACEPHTCPYKSDIHNDNETLCNCCDECERECCMDI